MGYRAKLCISDEAIQVCVDMDSDRAATFSLSDDEILQSLPDEHAKMTEADSEEDDPEMKVSWKDAAKGLAVFVKFAEQCTNKEEKILSRDIIYFMKVGTKSLVKENSSVEVNAPSKPPTLNAAIHNSVVKLSDDELDNW
ncbi:uncharacterized protein LOC143037679 [Oratosquilla oratoria]|uniref:uncharacterized protein LOC143037679 n=1 Tax=Oratosquilla oratoria TaxID=337810 RepID=UPI003F75CCEF